MKYITAAIRTRKTAMTTMATNTPMESFLLDFFLELKGY